jgi:hypothetical protein
LILTQTTSQMKFQGLIITAFFLTSCLLRAQTDFRSGYIINLNGDTLTGEVDYRGDFIMGEMCRFRMNGSKHDTTFYPRDIFGYRFVDGKYFISKEVNGKKAFLEYLINGIVSIYYLKDDMGDHYFLDKNGSDIVEIPPYKEEIKYNDGIPYMVKSAAHIPFLYFYMQDAPGLRSDIENLKKPDHGSLIKLAKDYHNLVCLNSSCIIYEKKMPLVRLDIELSGGIIKYTSDDVNDKYYFHTGLLAHLWMPATSEKLFLRFGVLYSTLEAGVNKFRDFKFPIQLEYKYPKGVIRPNFALGLNVLSTVNLAPSFMLGINVKLHNKIFWGIKYDIDFYGKESFPLFPRSLRSQSILTGILIEL